MKKQLKKIIKVLLVLIIAGALIYVVGVTQGWFNKEDAKKVIKKLTPTVKKSNIKIIDEDSNQRPYAIMIDNVSDARPQTGINKAYIVYELMVEGGLTRLMAVFKDAKVDQIGPVRSSRHYYLDYAMENDAIYIHYGWSPQAQSDISSLKINNLNGLANPSNMFWRDYTYHKGEHTAYTSTEKINKAAENKGYRLTSDDSQLLDYSEKSVSMDETKIANEIKISYSSGTKVTYKYDTENKVYLRYMNGYEHKETSSGQLKAKNIIAYNITYGKIANDVKGRQEMSNTGSGTGYYFTEGKYMEIKWSKSSRSSKTVYTDTNGKEIKVNDGNTYIQIYPTGQNITIS